MDIKRFATKEDCCMIEVYFNEKSRNVLFSMDDTDNTVQTELSIKEIDKLINNLIYVKNIAQHPTIQI